MTPCPETGTTPDGRGLTCDREAGHEDAVTGGVAMLHRDGATMWVEIEGRPGRAWPVVVRPVIRAR